MPFQHLPILLMGLVMTACSPDLASNPFPPPPANARASVEEGPQEQRLDEVVIQIREAVQDRDRPLQVETFRLAPGADWEAVSGHYGAAFDWPRDQRLADHLRGARARAWRKGERVFAIAMIEQPIPGKGTVGEPLLVVARSD